MSHTTQPNRINRFRQASLTIYLPQAADSPHLTETELEERARRAPNGPVPPQLPERLPPSPYALDREHVQQPELPHEEVFGFRLPIVLGFPGHD